MTIEKKLFLQLREKAIATCNNVYLMQNGSLLSNTEYKTLNFIDKLQLVLYYKYTTNEIIKI